MSKTFSYDFCQNVGSIVNASCRNENPSNAYPSKQEAHAALSKNVSYYNNFSPIVVKVGFYTYTYAFLNRKKLYYISFDMFGMGVPLATFCVVSLHVMP